MAAAVSSKLLEEDSQSRSVEGQQQANGGGMVGQPGSGGNSSSALAGMSRKLDQEILSNLVRMDQDNEGWIARWARALPELHEEWRREV